jgi:hypothetical protein
MFFTLSEYLQRTKKQKLITNIPDFSKVRKFSKLFTIEISANEENDC